MKKLLLRTAVFALLSASIAQADDVFHLNIAVDGVQKSFSFSNAEDFINANKGTSLNQLFPNYTSNSSVFSQLDVRGLPATLSAGAGSSTIRLQIPSLGIDRTFTGATRDDSVDALRDFFKSTGGSLLTDIQKKLVAVSPVDVVAGNPNSVQSTLVSRSFMAGSPVALGAIGPNGADRSAVQNEFLYGSENLFLLGGSIDHVDAGGHEGFAASLPLGVSFGFDSHPGYRLTFQLPLSYYDFAGSKAYQVEALADLQIPLTHRWFLYPQLSYGIAGSEDLASLGQVVSGGVTSKYHFTLGGIKDVEFVLGNSLGYSRSLALNIGDYSFDPEVSNVYTTNGLSAIVPAKAFFGSGSGDMSLDYNYTHYFGTELYINDYHDISLGYTFPAQHVLTSGTVALHYTTGEHYDEYGLRLQLAF